MGHFEHGENKAFAHPTEEDALRGPTSPYPESTDDKREPTMADGPRGRDEQPGRGGARKNIMRQILHGWWQEFAYCAVGVAALAALAGVLHRFDGETMPDWPSGLTLNTIVALLATVCRAAFVIPVTEALAQAKWNWFREKPRSLGDFEAFDQASRGPWGSLNLVRRTRGWLVGILAAILLTSAIATSTLTQSAISYTTALSSYVGWSDVEGRSWSEAQAWSLKEDWGERFPDFVTDNEPSVARGIALGILTPASEVLSFREPRCLAKNCTWDPFSTLAVCHETTNVTHLIDSKSDPARGINVTTPNSVEVEFSRDTAAVHVSEGAITNPTYLGNASIWTAFAVYWTGNENDAPQATELTFHWCVNTYRAEVIENVLEMHMWDSHTEVLAGTNSSLGYLAPSHKKYNLHSVRTRSFTYGRGGDRIIAKYLNSSMIGRSAGSTTERFWGASGSDVLLQSVAEITEAASSKKPPSGVVTASAVDAESPWWGAVDGMARNVANGLTNSLLPREPNALGRSSTTRMLVQVRWSWLGLLIGQVLLSFFLLIATIIETARADVAIVKSSALPALFAISAKEKAELERSIAEGEPLINKSDHRLVQMGLGGGLRQQSGKWILAGT
ncbi:hypothetical protein CPLU01_15061 [Colletotrichum plurivorum]|uniref:Uncharacterized protein n=1 Tax=Colletotrichum plurivorum TaxID=2175906 RepID=A0A8H6MXA8_9PEZI|nr:hypothetical protein CPLU01_15061 [Colletotrichum plurivorum]